MPTKLAKMSRWLRQNFPTKMPVIIRMIPRNKDHHGCCLIGDGRALIRIARDTDQVMIETLIEEWSHCLRAEAGVPIEDDHDQMFWAILAAITKKYRGE